MAVELAISEGNVVGMDQDAEFSDSELVFQLKQALKLSIQGDYESYNELVTVMNHGELHGQDQVALLVTCFKALSGAVSCIHMLHHRTLLDSIYSRSLWEYGTDVMDALLQLLLSLASSSGQHVGFCLNMLVTNFIPPLDKPQVLTKKRHVLDRVHSTFKDIADLVPLSPRLLETIVIDRMPHSSSTLHTNSVVMYVENMLLLENGALGKVLGRKMLVAIMDLLVELDVKIDCDDITEEDVFKTIDFGEFEGIGDADYQSSEMRESYLHGQNKNAVNLDSLLVLTFEHLKLCHESGRLKQVFKYLLQSFQTTVLTVHKSKFAQFVMFYACSLDPVKCGIKFTTVLKNIFFNDIYPQRRMSAVAYLASFLSRANFMSASVVATMLGSLATWCSDYCKNQDEGINPEVRKVFYAGCQAIMYVLCFRMRSMVLIPRLKLQLRLLNLPEILRHPLSPLKVCLPVIVEEFLHTIRETKLFSVSEIQEADDLREPQLSRAFDGVEILDMFFPFEPCLLKKSDSFIKPNFVYWWMVKSSTDYEEEEGSSDDDIAEAQSFDDEFGHSLDKMSITPKESLLNKCASRNFHMQMPSKIRPSTSPE